MEATRFIAVAIALFVAIYLPMILSGAQSKADQDAARERRMAEYKMNARLLSFNL